ACRSMPSFPLAEASRGRANARVYAFWISERALGFKLSRFGCGKSGRALTSSALSADTAKLQGGLASTMPKIVIQTVRQNSCMACILASTAGAVASSEWGTLRHGVSPSPYFAIISDQPPLPTALDHPE